MIPTKRRFPQWGTTLIELLVVLSVMIFLATALYRIMNMAGKSFMHARNKLDILLTTRIIMASIRNDLRNAIDKPESKTVDKRNVLYIPVKDKYDKDKIIIYLFDEEKRRLFKGEKTDRDAPDPELSTFHSFLFDDGQILKFDLDSSYRDADSFAESELSLDTKVWYKVTMKILFTEKYKSLSDADRQKIASDPNDPRVKTFIMMITPRRINWLLQGTQ